MKKISKRYENLLLPISSGDIADENVNRNKM